MWLGVVVEFGFSGQKHGFRGDQAIQWTRRILTPMWPCSWRCRSWMFEMHWGIIKTFTPNQFGQRRLYRTLLPPCPIQDIWRATLGRAVLIVANRRGSHNWAQQAWVGVISHQCNRYTHSSAVGTGVCYLTGIEIKGTDSRESVNLPGAKPREHQQSCEPFGCGCGHFRLETTSNVKFQLLRLCARCLQL